MSSRPLLIAVLSLALLPLGCDKKSESKSGNGGSSPSGSPNMAGMNPQEGGPGAPGAGQMSGGMPPGGAPETGAEVPGGATGAYPTPGGMPPGGPTGATGAYPVPGGMPPGGATGATGAYPTPGGMPPDGPMGDVGAIPGGPMGAGGFQPGGQQNAGPPKFKEGSAQNATVQFVLKLKAKDYEGMRKYVHPKALGRLKGFTANAKPGSSDLEYLHGLLGRVKVYRSEPFERAGGDLAFVLLNDRSQLIQFRCRKEGSAFLIRDLDVSRYTGGAAAGRGERGSNAPRRGNEQRRGGERRRGAAKRGGYRG